MFPLVIIFMPTLRKSKVYWRMFPTQISSLVKVGGRNPDWEMNPQKNHVESQNKSGKR